LRRALQHLILKLQQSGATARKRREYERRENETCERADDEG
jgi:hypothetical protein